MVESILDHVKRSEPELAGPLGIDKFMFESVDVNNFLKTFETIDNMDSSEFRTFVTKTIRMAAEKTVEKVPGVAAVFMNRKFMNELTNCILDGRIRVNDDFDLRRNLCKIAYDYIVKKMEPDEVITNYMINIVENINMPYGVAFMYSKGINRTLACAIAAAKYSSTDSYIAIRRINRAIIDLYACDIPVTPQNIADVYLGFYSTCFRTLFNGVMFDVYPRDLLNQLSDKQNEMYSTISNVITELLDYLPEKDICTVLVDFNAAKIRDGKKKVRFRITAVSADYQKINRAIDILEECGTYI